MIKIAGRSQLQAPIREVWPHIFDPTSLMHLIPGCQELRQVSPDEYRGQIQVAIAAVSGTYATYVRLVESNPPHNCSFRGEVSGAAGTINGEASFTLKEVGAQTSLIEYEAKGLIVGALARLNPRYVEGIAQTMIKQGLASLNQQLQARAEMHPARDDPRS